MSPFLFNTKPIEVSIVYPLLLSGCQRCTVNPFIYYYESKTFNSNVGNRLGPYPHPQINLHLTIYFVPFYRLATSSDKFYGDVNKHSKLAILAKIKFK